MSRQVRETVEIFIEKERGESKITPRLRTVEDSGKGVSGGDNLGGWRAKNSDLDLLIRRRRDVAQEVIADRISATKVG